MIFRCITPGANAIQIRQSFLYLYSARSHSWGFYCPLFHHSFGRIDIIYLTATKHFFSCRPEYPFLKPEWNSYFCAFDLTAVQEQLFASDVSNIYCNED